MKLGSSLLALALLLLTGPLASASSTGAADTPDTLVEGDAATMTSIEASPGCSVTELPLFAPAPSEQARGICGECSESPCQNNAVGDLCGFSGGRYYSCEIPYAAWCSDSRVRCECWTGPLP